MWNNNQAINDIIVYYISQPLGTWMIDKYRIAYDEYIDLISTKMEQNMIKINKYGPYE